MKNNMPTLENCYEVYKELWSRYNISFEELISYILRTPTAQIMTGVEEGTLPEGSPTFSVDDIQKKHYKEAKKIYDQMREQIEEISRESEKEYQEMIEEQHEQEKEKIKSRRLEYFTKNTELNKIPLPEKTLENIIEKIEKDCTYCPEIPQRHIRERKEEIREQLHDYIHENYEKHMNEIFATTVFPHLTMIISGQCVFQKFPVYEEDTKVGEKVEMGEAPYLLSCYEYVDDFLKKMNGNFYQQAQEEESRYGIFEDTLYDFIFDETENFIFQSFFKILKESFSCDPNDEEKETLFTNMTTYLFPFHFINELTQQYIDVIRNLYIEELFNTYNIKDQEENYNFCINDEQRIDDETGKINNFIDSLKTSTPKQFVIYDIDLKYTFFMDSKNQIINDEGLNVEQQIKDLFWEICGDYETESIFVLYESTPIKNKENKEQKKVYGFVIANGAFLSITKESLRELTEQFDGEEQVKHFSFFEWNDLEKLPVFTKQQDEDEEQ